MKKVLVVVLAVLVSVTIVQAGILPGAIEETHLSDSLKSSLFIVKEKGYGYLSGTTDAYGNLTITKQLVFEDMGCIFFALVLSEVEVNPYNVTLELDLDGDGIADYTETYEGKEYRQFVEHIFPGYGLTITATWNIPEYPNTTVTLGGYTYIFVTSQCFFR